MTKGREMNAKIKLDGIRTEILYRKKVLNQKFPPSCGYFSHGGKACSLEEMVAKLKHIITMA